MSPPSGDILIAERIVRLETKLDFLIAQIDRLPPSPVCVVEHKTLHVRIDDTHAKLEERITLLEGWRNKALGVLLAVNIVIAAALTKFMNWIFR